MNDTHIVIVGAGFAGLTAARELQAAGLSCEIVEARDRIGGRAWTADRMGRPLELGATWVHWHQPHVWTEITRYGQQIVSSPVDNDAYWVTDGEVRSGTEADLDNLLEAPMRRIFEGSREFFPNPHDPLHVLSEDFDGPAEVRERFLAADQASVLDPVRTGEFTREEQDLCDAYWSAGYIGDPNTGSSLMAKQWAALCDHRLSLVDEQTLRYKLVDGMRGIYGNIAADLDCPIRLNTPVTAVEHHDTGATVTLADGEEITADAVIVTAPVGALDTIDFTPPLAEGLQRTIDQKWNSTGFKIWIKVKGHHRIIGYAPTPATVAVFRSEYFMDDGTTICVGFGSHHDQVDLESVDDAQKIVDQWRPDLEVVDCTGHDWVADTWSGQAWATLRQGQFADAWHHFGRTDTRLYFAGADWAKGWRGVVVDGAIEQGISTARRVIDAVGRPR
ncbi:NAD(P)/FAD-dependent oxidoreductase [Corynebacterium kalidii]|uniref:FAD-dependent oxidoreductase n=1 Tax=Corynebacterium kalidii TaxID=2931982 RepID=A0A9X2B1L4_9CORY|nr:NAD(P)/FAD-dependent oxidoreductase [Corynebacterium kalidii]MCJ7858164.1 FAD-dependent oxidoreductase [Corynebacterium kalidii]